MALPEIASRIQSMVRTANTGAAMSHTKQSATDMSQEFILAEEDVSDVTWRAAHPARPRRIQRRGMFLFLGLSAKALRHNFKHENRFVLRGAE
jgi:hypothetical protein